MSLTGSAGVSRIRIIGSGVEGRTDNHFAQPRGICIDEAAKELFVVDCNNHRVCVISLVSLTFLRQIGRGIQGSGPGCLNYAVGACLDFKNHHIYVADTNNHRISVFDQVTGVFIRCIGFHGSGRGELNSPYGVCIDEATGSLFVTDYDNHRVQVFDIASRKFLRTIGSGLGSGPGQMNQPIVPYLDSETGFLYIADYSNNRVQIFDKDSGAYIRQIGGGGVGGSVSGLGADALNGPRGICIDKVSGLLFIADRENHRIKVYDKSTFVFLKFLGDGQGASPGQFHRPMELCISADDSSIFVVDGYNHRVQVFFLPELQAARKAATMINENKNKEGTVDHVRPSKLCLESRISLLRIPKYHLQSTALTSNTRTQRSRVDLYFPHIGSYISVPSVDIDHLLRMGFFSSSSTSTPGEDFHYGLDTSNALAPPDYLKYEIAKLPNNSNSKLNHQAAVFMGLITGVAVDSMECSTAQTASERDRSEGTLTTALDFHQNQSDFSIDYSLIVPSVFALDALLNRGWLPGVSIPSPVIHSLVHLMCYGEATESSTGSSAERRRATSAAAAILIAAVGAGRESCEAIFSYIIEELQISSVKFSPSDLETNGSGSHYSSDATTQQGEIPQILVTSFGSDRSILGEGGPDAHANGVKYVDDEDGRAKGSERKSDWGGGGGGGESALEGDPSIHALRLIALILSSESDTAYPYPMSLLSQHTVGSGREASLVAPPTAGPSLPAPPGHSKVLTSASVSKCRHMAQIRMLVLGLAWTTEHDARHCEDERGREREMNRSVGLKGLPLPHISALSSRSASQCASPLPLHSFPPFPLGSSSSAYPFPKEYSSRKDSSVYSSSLCNLTAETLDLVTLVSKMNRRRQVVADLSGLFDDFYEDLASVSALQLDLFKKAKICFTQLPVYKETSRQSRKAAQGGRHIWQIGEPLAVGDLVDARDREKSWFESYVTEVRPSAAASSPTRAGSQVKERLDVKVHYMGWGSKWDDWVSEWDLGSRIAPLNSRSKNWRADLFEGGLIEIKCNDDMVNQKWMWGKIIALNFTEGWVDVSYTFTNEPTVVKRADLFGETLCMVGMHTKDKSKLAAASIVRPERKVEDLLRFKTLNRNSPTLVEDFSFCDMDDALTPAESDILDTMREVDPGTDSALSITDYPDRIDQTVCFMPKMDIHGLSSLGAANSISSVSFNCVMREVLETLTEYLYDKEEPELLPIKTGGSYTASSGTESLARVQAATDVLHSIAASAARHVLVPFFCRALTVQCGVRAKLMVQNEWLRSPNLLRVDVSVSPLTALLVRLDHLGDRYCSLLLECFDPNRSEEFASQAYSLPVDQLQHAARRIKATVTKCAVTPLAQRLYRHTIPSSPSPSSCPCIHLNSLATALTDNFLNGPRFNTSATAVRKLLCSLMRSSSAKDLDVLEVLWTDTISSWVVDTVDRCCTSSSSAGVLHELAGTSCEQYINAVRGVGEGDENASDHQVDHTNPQNLMISVPVPVPACVAEDVEDREDNLSDRREESFSHLLHQVLSMLHKARSISALEFSVTHRCTRSADVAFRTAFELISDDARCGLIRAMVRSIDVHQTSSSHRNILRGLDGVRGEDGRGRSRGSGRDVSGEDWSESEREGELTLESLLELIKILLSEENSKYFETCYQLQLAHRLIRSTVPEGISERRGRFTHTERSVLDSLPPMSMASKMINDIDRTCDTMSDFRHRLLTRLDSDDMDCEPNNSYALSLAVKPGALTVHTLSASHWPTGCMSATAFSSLILPPTLSVMADEFESFFHSSSSTDVRYINVLKFKNSFSPPDDPKGESRPGGSRRLHWCHGEGSVTLTCRLNEKPGGFSVPFYSAARSTVASVTLVLSTPQAAVLLAFQSTAMGPSSGRDRDCGERSVLDISLKTGLWGEELACVLQSLCDSALPLLCRGRCNSEAYILSPRLLSGQLGGSDDTLIAKSSANPNKASIQLSRSWRDTLIDACIIRTLKKKGTDTDKGKDKSDYFVTCKGVTNSNCLSFHDLCTAVKTVLELKSRLVVLPSEDVRVRCNYLVEKGYIEAVKGLSSLSLQSMGYAYQVQVPAPATSTCPLREGIPNGDKLFHQVCNVVSPTLLGTVSAEDIRISCSQFSRAVMGWMVKSPFESRVTSSTLNTFPMVRSLAPIPIPTPIPVPVPYGIASLGPRNESPVQRRETGRMYADDEDRSGEQKDNIYLANIRCKSYPQIGTRYRGMTPREYSASNESLRSIHKKLVLAFSASVEQVRRLKHQHLLIFGIDGSTVPFRDTHFSTSKKDHLVYRNLIDGLGVDSEECETLFDVNKTVLCSLPRRTIQLVLDVFESLQTRPQTDHVEGGLNADVKGMLLDSTSLPTSGDPSECEGEGEGDESKGSPRSTDSRGSSNNGGGANAIYTVAVDRWDFKRITPDCRITPTRALEPPLDLESCHVKKPSASHASVEGKNLDNTPASQRQDSQGVKSKGGSEAPHAHVLDSRAVLIERVKSSWDQPSRIREDSFQALLESLSAASIDANQHQNSTTSPPQSHPHSTDIAYNSFYVHPREGLSLSLSFLEHIQERLHFADPHSGDEERVSPHSDSTSSHRDDVTDAFSSSPRRKSPSAISGLPLIAERKLSGLLSSDRSGDTPSNYMTLSEFVALALRVASPRGVDRAGFARRSPAVPSSVSGKSESDRYDPSRSHPDSFYTDSNKWMDDQSRFATGAHTQTAPHTLPHTMKNAAAKDHRVREKTSRICSSNRDRKVRMRVTRSTPTASLSSSGLSNSFTTGASDDVAGGGGEAFECNFNSLKTIAFRNPPYEELPTTLSLPSSADQSASSRFLFGTSYHTPRTPDMDCSERETESGGSGSGTGGSSVLSYSDTYKQVSDQLPTMPSPFRHLSYDSNSNSNSSSASPNSHNSSMFSDAAKSHTPVLTPRLQLHHYDAAPPAAGGSPSISTVLKNPYCVSTATSPHTSAKEQVTSSCDAPLVDRNKWQYNPFYSEQFDNTWVTGKKAVSSSGGSNIGSGNGSGTESSLQDAISCYMRKMDICLGEILGVFESTYSRAFFATEQGGPLSAEKKAEESTSTTILENTMLGLLDNITSHSLKPSRQSRHNSSLVQVSVPISRVDVDIGAYMRYIEECFYSLDIDKDGYLTLRDFTEEDLGCALESIASDVDSENEEENEDGSEEKSTEQTVAPSGANISVLSSPSETSPSLASSPYPHSPRTLSLVKQHTLGTIAIDSLVQRILQFLECDMSMSHQVLHLLVQFKWDPDALLLHLTESSRAGVRESISAERSYRMMSATLNRLGPKRKGENALVFPCVCGSFSNTCDVYAMKECGHWLCRTCWLDVIYSSRESLSAPQSSLWKCPHTGCGATMQGDFVSNLRGKADTYIQWNYYISQLHSNADYLHLDDQNIGDSSFSPSLSSTYKCPSPASAEVMAWWTGSSQSSSPFPKISKGDTRSSHFLFQSAIELGHIVDKDRERDTSSSGGASPADHINGGLLMTIEAYRRIVGSADAAERCALDATTAAESAVDGAAAVRLLNLSDRWGLLVDTLTLLAHTHVMLAAEAEFRDASQPLFLGRSGESWADMRCISTYVEVFERLAASYSDALSKLTSESVKNTQQTGPEICALTVQTHNMAGTVRMMQGKLIERLAATHRLQPKCIISAPDSSVRLEREFNVSPLH